MNVRLWLRGVKSLVRKAQIYHVTPSRLASWAMKESYIPIGFDLYLRVKIGSGHCHWPYSAGLIYVNGDFAPCCYLARGEHILGNVFEQGSIRAVWSSERLSLP